MTKTDTHVDPAALDAAIRRVNNNTGNTMVEDTQKKLDDAAEKVEEANEKVLEARPGSVVGIMSAFGTPSSYEDPYHPDGKPIGRVEADAKHQDQRFADDQESLAKARVEAAEEEVRSAEAAVSAAQSESENSDEASNAQRVELQEQREADAEEKRQQGR